MCGILGDIGPGFDGTQFRQALQGLHHRGPYGEGYIDLPAGALGMTRLPMSGATSLPIPVRFRENFAAYNGEVYSPNAEIIDEVRLLYEGIEKGELPDGMFALALWQPHSASLILQRDSYGIKPLYYFYQADRGRLIFSSELMPLLTLLGNRTPNIAAIAQIVATGVTLEGESLFSGIRLVAPGEQLRFRLGDGKALLVQRQHFPPQTEPTSTSIEETLGEAINRCKATFRPTALLLSGGMDSTLLNTWVEPDMAKFTLALENAEETVCSKSNLHWISLEQTAFMSVLRKAVKNFGAATRMSSLLMYQQLADAVGDAGYHCVLLGEGADELFWGYPRYLDLQPSTGHDAVSFARIWFGDYQNKAKLLSSQVASELNEQIEALASSALRKGYEAAIDYFDLHYSLEPLLRRADHLLMSRAIEARTPYLHAGLGMLASRSTRLAEGITKIPLCNLLQQRLPNWQWKPKQHFRLPFSYWPKAVQEMRHHLLENCETLRDLGLVNLAPAYIEAMDNAQLFTLTTLSLWQQEYEVNL
ncbi:putative asparagine synthetase [Xenorhabdus stockiae]|uniref:asparagine synthase (glutamine-hydrolyzing) n=1 Tax=Xenorhabdus stockiae TaxID=351614 RepID=A0A2D0KBL7_9GAMM|nr:asparagine synthetase B [Xenorhabdus stockiae]PHM60705.1 putative asparagine synthetase [Xenorhabdus stockiae]